MSAITVNAFPPLHAFNSSRAWFLALILLVHLGFFWALTSGLAAYVLPMPPPQPPEFLPMRATPQVPPKPRPIDEPLIKRIYVPIVDQPQLPREDTASEPMQVTSEPQPVPRETSNEAPGSGPVIVEPTIDPRIGLSEPEYPVSEIRQQHQGTVWLSVEILPNGRVGQVRVDQSSGYAKLDASAEREARRWRMKPGMQDGVATAMWKRVPVTFRLKN